VETYREKYPKHSPSDLYFLIWSDYPTMLFSNFIAERRAMRKQAPTWLYRFEWETPVMGGRLKTSHTLEIPFVFDNIAYSPNLTGTGQDAFKLAAKMSETWLHFAETGDPNTPLGVQSKWQPYDIDSRATLLINNESRLAMDPEKAERELLKSIYL
jgi:para-nitrobenzyl esterase